MMAEKADRTMIPVMVHLSVTFQMHSSPRRSAPVNVAACQPMVARFYLLVKRTLCLGSYGHVLLLLYPSVSVIGVSFENLSVSFLLSLSYDCYLYDSWPNHFFHWGTVCSKARTLSAHCSFQVDHVTFQCMSL